MSESFSEGYQAAKDQGSTCECPYPEKTQKHYDWRFGFSAYKFQLAMRAGHPFRTLEVGAFDPKSGQWR